MLPNHDFLQLLSIKTPVAFTGPVQLQYDAEWLAVLRATDHLHSSIPGQLLLDLGAVSAVSNGRTRFSPDEEEVAAVEACVGGCFGVPLNFQTSAPAYREGESIHAAQSGLVESTQTLVFVNTFGLQRSFRSQRGATMGTPGTSHRHAEAGTNGCIHHNLAAYGPPADGACLPPMPILGGDIELDDDV